MTADDINTGGDRLADACLNYETARAQLTDAITLLRTHRAAGTVTTADGRDVGAALTQLSKALTIALEQEARARDRQDRETGGGIDLDAARLEVGRRLARLAAEGDA